MTVKSDIRRRRDEKIKGIVEKEKSHAPWPPVNVAEPQLPPPERGHDVHVPPQDPRMADPEYVWNMRQKQLGWEYDPFERSGKEEEKSWKEWTAAPTRGQFRLKLLVCVVLFVLIWGSFRVHTPWIEPVRRQITQAMTEDMDFQAVDQWYKSVFKGSPSFLPAFRLHLLPAQAQRPSFSPPLKGLSASAWNSGDQGVLLRTAAQAPIAAVAAGRVVYVGQQSGTGLNVWIQHAGGWTSVYGLLDATKLHANDWVKEGQAVGNASAGAGKDAANFYFALMKDKKYVNPADVISFD